MSAFPRLALAFGMGVMLLTPSMASAQYCRSYRYSPGTAYSAGVLAEADFVRAEGEYLVSSSVANRVWVDAYDKALDNALKELRNRITARIEGEAERYRRNPTLLQRQIKVNENLWTRFRDYPELSSISISNGTALNFLLDRLSGSVLAYQLSAGAENQRVSAEKLELLTLEPATVSKLRVKQRLNSGRASFGLRDGELLDVNFWPAALRDSSLRMERTQFEQARAETMASQNEESLANNLKNLSKAWEQLRKAFAEQHTHARRTASLEVHREYNESLKHLENLYREYYRIKATGMKGLKNDSLRFEGTSLIAMLTHMSRNGLEFDKPNPGDESAYHQTFKMMKDLYLVVAPDEPVAKR